MLNSSSIFSLSITQFPQNLLIPNTDNVVNIQITNNSEKSEKFQFVFEGENLSISLESEELKDLIEFASKETKNFDIKLQPETDGFGKLIINAYLLKIVEYTVKVQKVRETVPKRKNDSLFEKYRFKEAKKIDSINPKDFFLEMSQKELKKGEDQLSMMKKYYTSSLSTNHTGNEPFPKVSLEDIDKHIMKLAKGYLTNNNILKSLQLTLELSDQTEQVNFYSTLIRTFAFENTDEVIKLIKDLQDQKIKQKLFTSIVLDQIPVNPISSIKLAESSDDISLKIKILFNIAKQFYIDKKASELSNILNRIFDSSLVSLQASSEKKEQKELIGYLVDSLCILAEVENPGVSHSIIESISKQELKERVKKEAFDTIYMLVDEVKTKIDSEVIFSQYFLLNTYISNINSDVVTFGNAGGNVSSNILLGDFNFNLAILSLFRFDFSIFPILDRVYNEVKFNMKKSIGYYVFPSVNYYKEAEMSALKTTLTQFFKNFTQLSSKLSVFNLDFIPYLGKPTIIISSESHLTESLQAKIQKLGDKVNFIVDDSMFKGGKIYEVLKEIFPPVKCEITN
ncbi:MAG: hypothetical protein ACFFE4_11865, partial [Candidatus Thorarchaeota archaeon]